jgi:RimJ/RimL family protein N-acetyltransferase
MVLSFQRQPNRDLGRIPTSRPTAARPLGLRSTTRLWRRVSDHDNQLAGSCCFGPEARVPGIDEQPGTLDVGYGMRADLVGRRLGRQFVEAILIFASDEFSPQRLRVLTLTWNQRSRKVAEACGFAHQSTVAGLEGDFLIMTRPPL